MDGAVVPRGRGVPLLRARSRARRHHDAAPADERPAAPARRSPRTTRSSRSGRRAAPRTSRTAPRSSAPSSRGSAAIGTTAAHLYEQAIRSAREHGFVHNEAIAYETAARFYRARGLDADRRHVPARGPRPLSPVGRRRQGAAARAAASRSSSSPRPARTGDAVALRPEQLDLLSVIKASQTISGVMDQEQLSRTLLQLVLEEGGARRVPWSSSRARATSRSRPRPASTRCRRPPSGDARRARVAARRTCSGRRSRAARRRGRRRRPVRGRPVLRRAPARARCCACRSAGRRSRSRCSTSRTTSSRARSRPSACSRSSCWPRRRRSRSRTRCCSSASTPGGSRRRRPSSARSLLGEATALMSQTLDYAGRVRRAGPAVRAIVRRLGGDRSRGGGRGRCGWPARTAIPARSRCSASSRSATRRAPARRAARRRVLRTGEPLDLPTSSDEQRSGLRVDEHHAELLRAARHAQRDRRAARRARHPARRADARVGDPEPVRAAPTSSSRRSSAGAWRWRSTTRACSRRPSARCGCATSSCSVASHELRTPHHVAAG